MWATRYEKIALSHSLCLFILAHHSEERQLLNLVLLFSLGLNFSIFSIGQMFKGKCQQPCSIHCVAPPQIPWQLASLSSKSSLAVAFSCLTQVCVPSLGIRHPVTGRCSCMKPQPPAPTQHQLCRAIQFRAPMERAQLLQLHFSSASPSAQPCLPYRCGFRVVSRAIHCLHHISASEPSSQNLVHNTKHIRISVKIITSPNGVKFTSQIQRTIFCFVKMSCFFSWFY